MTPLRQRMLDALILRGMAPRTQESYIDAVARLARHYKRSPAALSAEEVQGYLLHLLRERQRSRSTRLPNSRARASQISQLGASALKPPVLMAPIESSPTRGLSMILASNWSPPSSLPPE